MCESLLKKSHSKTKTAPQTLEQMDIKGMRGVKSRNIKVKKWFVIMKLNTDGERTHACTHTHVRSHTYPDLHTCTCSPACTHVHTQAETSRASSVRQALPPG